MKSSQFIGLLMPLFFAIACANENSGESSKYNDAKDSTVAISAVVSDTFPAGKLLTQVLCKANSTQSYALYIPATGDSQDLPVVYFFDPHGDGSFPLGKYKKLADTYKFILVGSNNSKNGNDWPTTENMWNILFDDSQKRIKVNPNRIYTCGFSGGAKVASYIALTHREVKGVIANGAGLPDASGPGNFNFTFTAVAGEGDMNMTDLVDINMRLDKTTTRHRIIFFDGKHEWAPEATMNLAFAGLELDAMYEKVIPRSDAFINDYVAISKTKIANYFKINNYIKAERECALSISLLDALSNNVKWFKEKDTLIRRSPVYQKEKNSQQNLLVAEQSLKTTYMQKFEQADMSYWSKTIGDLQTKAKTHTDEGVMYQRLLAYLSLAFYSISNQLITAGRNKEAEYFVGLYKITDATNSEAWYFSAILNARNGDAKTTKADLLKAVACGFTDKNRLMQQAEFKNPGVQINLEEIERTMK